jgi:hypothetical protein
LLGDLFAMTECSQLMEVALYKGRNHAI